MGHLIIDHSGYDKKPGTAFGLNEFTTVSCVHCQALIVHFDRGCTKYAVSGVDVMAAFLATGALPTELTQACGCRKCGELICHACAKAMEDFKLPCPGPAEAQAERAMEISRISESLDASRELANLLYDIDHPK